MVRVRAPSCPNSFFPFFLKIHKSLELKYLGDKIPTVQFPMVKIPAVKIPSKTTVLFPTVKIPAVQFPPKTTVQFPAVKIPTVKRNTVQSSTVKITTVKIPSAAIPGQCSTFFLERKLKVEHTSIKYLPNIPSPVSWRLCKVFPHERGFYSRANDARILEESRSSEVAWVTSSTGISIS